MESPINTTCFLHVSCKCFISLSSYASVKMTWEVFIDDSIHYENAIDLSIFHKDGMEVFIGDSKKKECKRGTVCVSSINMKRVDEEKKYSPLRSSCCKSRFTIYLYFLYYKSQHKSLNRYFDAHLFFYIIM